jgi:hypothetical protein
VGPKAGLDVCEKSSPAGIRSPDRPARSQSLYRLSYPAHICTSTEKYSTPRIISQHSVAHSTGRAVAHLVEALRYKPEGRGSLEFSIDNNSGRTSALWSNQPLTELSTAKITAAGV